MEPGPWTLEQTLLSLTSESLDLGPLWTQLCPLTLWLFGSLGSGFWAPDSRDQRPETRDVQGPEPKEPKSQKSNVRELGAQSIECSTLY